MFHHVFSSVFCDCGTSELIAQIVTARLRISDLCEIQKSLLLPVVLGDVENQCVLTLS